MGIGILADSTCDLPQKYIDKYNIEKIPLNVHFGNQSYQDEVDINTEEFFKKLSVSEKLPQTSQPAIGLFIEKYQELAQKYEKIISIHLSEKLSGTVKAARLAARQLPELEIEVINSYSVSIGLGFQVVQAAKMIENNYSIREVIANLKRLQNNMRIYFTASDLNYLEKGGRIGKASAFLGTILNFNPILEVGHDNGEILPFEKVRGVKKTMKRMVALFNDNLSEDSKTWVGIINGDNKSVFNDFKDQVQELLINRNSFIVETRLSPVLSSHIGPTVYGFAMVKGDFLQI